VGRIYREEFPMIFLHKPTLLALCSAIALLLPCVGSAQDDYERRERRPSTRGDTEREERSPSARLSERDQRSFESFLNSHDETAQELYRDPHLVNNDRFLRGHSALRDWLDEHPDAAKALRNNPRTVIWQERGTRGQERSTGEREREERRPTTGETLRDLLK
jgi:hypothetical protein